MSNEMNEVKKLVESRGMTYKGDWFENLSEEEKNAGYIKFNIPDEDNPHKTGGEGVWGWVTPENKKKYDDDNCYDVIKAILCNSPLNYMGFLFWGVEVEIKCNGDCRPTLNPEWVKKYIIDTEWYKVHQNKCKAFQELVDEQGYNNDYCLCVFGYLDTMKEEKEYTIDEAVSHIMSTFNEVEHDVVILRKITEAWYSCYVMG